MATILCAPPCPARTTMTSPARGKGGQWPGCPGTSKFLRGLGSSNSYATRNRCPSPNGFKGIGIKKYINCLTGLVLNSMGFKFSKHILLISCKRGIREFSRGSHWSKYRAKKKNLQNTFTFMHKEIFSSYSPRPFVIIVVDVRIRLYDHVAPNPKLLSSKYKGPKHPYFIPKK